MYTLGFFVGRLRLIEFLRSPLAITLSSILISLYGTPLQFHITLTVGKVSLAVLLFGVPVEV